MEYTTIKSVHDLKEYIRTLKLNILAQPPTDVKLRSIVGFFNDGRSLLNTAIARGDITTPYRYCEFWQTSGGREYLFYVVRDGIVQGRAAIKHQRWYAVM